MSDNTTMWRSRVAAWRASGDTAAAFAAAQGFSVSALRSWSSRLGLADRRAVATPPIRLARVARSKGPLIVELGDVAARIAIEGRVDREALAAVVAVLREATR
jgi:hypothetical protein